MIPLILLVLFIFFVGGCTALIGKAADEVDKDLNAEHKITYQITGDATSATASCTASSTDITNAAE